MRVEPQPDELFSGLIARMGRFNGCSVATVQKSLIAAAPKHDTRQTMLLAGLARVLDMKLGEVYFRHTLIPFEAAFSYRVRSFRDEQWYFSARTRMTDLPGFLGPRIS